MRSYRKVTATVTGTAIKPPQRAKTATGKVMTTPPVQYYPEPPCEKPGAMPEHIIKASSREGDLVADLFMESGATLKAALKHNRRLPGVEMEVGRFEQTESEIALI